MKKITPHRIYDILLTAEANAAGNGDYQSPEALEALPAGSHLALKNNDEAQSIQTELGENTGNYMATRPENPDQETSDFDGPSI